MRRVDNPPNPWATGHVEWLGGAPAAPPTVYEDDSRTSENDRPDLPFRWSDREHWLLGGAPRAGAQDPA